MSVICAFACADCVGAIAKLRSGEVRGGRSEVSVWFAGLAGKGFSCGGSLAVTVTTPGLEVGLDIGVRVCGC